MSLPFIPSPLRERVRSYVNALPGIVVTLARPAIMWFVDVDMRFRGAAGPLVRLIPEPAPGTAVADFLGGEPEGHRSVAAHRTALTGVQGRATLTAFGRRWQMTVTPMFEGLGAERFVIGAVGAAELDAPNEDEVAAVYQAMNATGDARQRLTFLAVVDLPEHGLAEGDELVVIPGCHREAATMRHLAPGTFAELFLGGLLVPSQPVTPPVSPRASLASASSGLGSSAGPYRRRLGRPSGPMAIPADAPLRQSVGTYLRLLV